MKIRIEPISLLTSIWFIFMMFIHTDKLSGNSSEEMLKEGLMWLGSYCALVVLMVLATRLSRGPSS